MIGVLFAFAGSYGIYLMMTGEAPVVQKDTPTAQAETESWLAHIQDVGADGDLVVIRGYKVADHLIAGTTFTKLTHAVVLDRKKMEVVEAIKPKVRVVALRDVVENAHRVVLIRPDRGQSGGGEEAVVKARSRVGQP